MRVSHLPVAISPQAPNSCKPIRSDPLKLSRSAVLSKSWRCLPLMSQVATWKGHLWSCFPEFRKGCSGQACYGLEPGGKKNPTCMVSPAVGEVDVIRVSIIGQARSFSQCLHTSNVDSSPPVNLRGFPCPGIRMLDMDVELLCLDQPPNCVPIVHCPVLGHPKFVILAPCNPRKDLVSLSRASV